LEREEGSLEELNIMVRAMAKVKVKVLVN